MTPPDSGETTCNETLGEDRVVYQCSRPRGHVGQHRDGNVTAWDQKPDSGEREVCSGSGHVAADRQGSYMSSTVPVAGKCGICGSVVRTDSEGRCVTHPFPARDRVSLPLALAQRILAALEDPDGHGRRWSPRALAASLRAQLPKELK